MKDDINVLKHLRLLDNFASPDKLFQTNRQTDRQTGIERHTQMKQRDRQMETDGRTDGSKIMMMIYLTSITWEVVAQSSEPRPHV